MLDCRGKGCRAPSYADAALELPQTALMRLLASAVTGLIMGGLGRISVALDTLAWVAITHGIALFVGMSVLVVFLLIPRPNFGGAAAADDDPPMLRGGAGDSQL